jgi:hypothetical protein
MMHQLRNKVKIKTFDKTRSQAIISEVFSKLKLGENNLGVYNGSWGGSGPDAISIDPSTNQPIATIKTVQA